MLENMQNEINAFRILIEKKISGYSDNLKGNPPELYDPLGYMLSLGGKRMRPLLVLLGCDLFGKDASRALNAALAVEVFHNFTLIHDDIMDNAPLRRNKKTVFKKWNSNIAILAGDAMMVKAYELLATYKELLPELLDLFNKTAIEVCEGQQLDMNYETQEADINAYLRMIELKTAVLLAASLQMGAIVSGSSKEDAKLLYDFGRNIGIAFQLQDDILDAYGNPEKFGKQAGGDILANKKTFLYLKALEKADQSNSDELKRLFSETSNKEEKVEKVLEIFNRYNIKEAAKKEMQSFFEKGKESLLKINASEEKKMQLLGFAQSLMEREI